MRQRIGYTALVLLTTVSSLAGAQIGRRRQQSAGSDYWVGLSYGYVDGTTIADGPTRTVWDFSYTSQIRATFEKMIQGNVSVGASAGFSTPSLQYTNADLSSPCGGAACTARADVTQWLGFLHVGSNGIGFHGDYNVEAGVTQFSHFRDDASGVALPPATTSNDFTFGFGGGLGYAFSPIVDAYVAEEFQYVLHPHGDAQETHAPRLTTFRAGFRMGF